MVIARPGGHREPDYLRDLMERENVTIVHFVPSMLDVFVETVGPSFPRVGAPCPGDRRGTSGALTNEVRSGRRIEILNTYGPTEAAVEITAYSVESEIVGGVPIGRPTPNSETLVLDAHFQRPRWARWASSTSAAASWHTAIRGKAGLTAERFDESVRPRRTDVPDRRPGALARRRESGVPGAHRLPGEDPRPARGARRGRGTGRRMTRWKLRWRWSATCPQAPAW